MKASHVGSAIAPRKDKIVHNFGLSESSRVKTNFQFQVFFLADQYKSTVSFCRHIRVSVHIGNGCFCQNFWVMGKNLSGELSCIWTGLVLITGLPSSGVYNYIAFFCLSNIINLKKNNKKESLRDASII